jgi:hypothetical protein
MAKAKILCHMFMLRIKAARYLYSEKTPGEVSVKKVSDMLSEGLKRTLPQTVSDGRLLGGIQRNASAMNQSHNVRHIKKEGGINFLEDQQTLALYIAVHYPNIEAAHANKIVAGIVTARTKKPRGFEEKDIKYWTQVLENANRPKKGTSCHWVTTHRP